MHRDNDSSRCKRMILQHDILFQARVNHVATATYSARRRRTRILFSIAIRFVGTQILFFFSELCVLGNTRRARFGFNTRAPSRLSLILRNVRYSRSQSGSVWHAYSCVNRNDSSLSWLAVTTALAAIILSSRVNHILTHSASKIACKQGRNKNYV